MNKKLLIGILCSVSIITLSACGSTKVGNSALSTNSSSKSSITSSSTNKSSESSSEKTQSSTSQTIIEEKSSVLEAAEEHSQEISDKGQSTSISISEQSEDNYSNDHKSKKSDSANSHTNNSKINEEIPKIPEQTIYSLDNLTGTWKDSATGFIYILGPLGFDDYFSWGSQAVERVIYLSSASSNENTVTANWGMYRETPTKNKVTITFKGNDEVNVNFDDGANYNLVRSK
ncbi:hypothetical protein BG262_03795 [Floricoccus penangensis]|uniref:Lipoprotein n=1 Tax=Floricoccus penangensis TaxID=1859475 RepID=A0A9Q5JGE8_9LACT|nr:hypothetical protein [Floricoccus penangensis]OFI46922.1 hypothetical protein BG262_03795 [Floricoccus penangensis]